MTSQSPEIHISDIRAFKSCRRKWNWSSPLRGYLEPNVPYAPFFTGRAVHYCLEQYYEQLPGERKKSPLSFLQTWLEAELAAMSQQNPLWPKEREKIVGETQIVQDMLEHYYDWITSDEHAKGKYSDDKLEFIAMETQFKVPFEPSIIMNEFVHDLDNEEVLFAGRFDGVIRHVPTNTYWLWEAKTARSIKELVRTLFNDEQAGGYILAAQKMFDVKIEGVLYNIMRKKAPTMPRVLKNGMLSQAKSIDTTHEAYMGAIRQHHVQPKDVTDEEYLERAQKVYGNTLSRLTSDNKYFARVPIRRTAHELADLERHIRATAVDMVNPGIPLYPNPSWNSCGFCLFRTPCLKLNQDGNADFLLKYEYRKRRLWDPVTAKEESKK